VVLVEGPAVILHQLVVLPGLRDHHRHSVREAAPCQVEELQSVVEGGGVALVRLDDGRELLHVLAEEGGLEAALAGAHPVEVPPQGVDLAVVRHVAVGVRQVPGS
jgi:hypothetical protein